MSKSQKRNFYEAYRQIDEGKGRIPVIRKADDRKVSHSHECWLCMKGTRPKRIAVKAARRNAKKMLSLDSWL